MLRALSMKMPRSLSSRSCSEHEGEDGGLQDGWG
jgi:hypothetical protein